MKELKRAGSYLASALRCISRYQSGSSVFVTGQGVTVVGTVIGRFSTGSPRLGVSLSILPPVSGTSALFVTESASN